METICNICYDCNVTVKCQFCNYIFCRNCFKQFIKNNNNDIINCMNCKIIYTRKSLIDLLGITYINGEFQKFQNNIRLERYKSNLYIYQERAKNELLLEKELKELEELKTIILEKKRIISNLQFILNNTDNIEQSSVNKYIRKCANNNCNGFLNSNWKCEICNMDTCKDCFEIITDKNSHKCDENLKASVDLLKKDTKSCPTCYSNIYKIDGCSQMFCTKCNTAFDWKTGEIVTKNIHNPHYYEFLRKNAKDGIIPTVQQLNCQERIIDDNTVRFCMRLVRNITIEDLKIRMNKFISFIRYYFHLTDLRQFGINDKLKAIKYRNLRLNIDFINNKITNDIYDTKIISNEKIKEMLNEKKLIISTLIDGINDLLYDLYVTNIIKINYKNKDTDINIPIFNEKYDILNTYILNLIEYSKLELEKINYNYKSKSKLDITYVVL